MKILIVEDDPNAVLTVKSTLFDLGYSEFHDADNADAALSLVKQENPDLILMDVGLNGDKTGIDVATKISHLKIPIIFITGSDDKETHDKAKGLNPYAYLLKPFSPFTLETSIYNVFKTLAEKGETEDEKLELILKDCIFVKTGTVLQKIKFDEILWVQSEGNYSIINTGAKKFALHTSLTKVIKKLPADIFLRIHKRYIAQASKIDRVDTNSKELFIEEHSIPVGRTYLKTLLSTFNKI